LLKTSRANLLHLYSDPANNLENVETEFNTYVSLLMGFMIDLSGRAVGDSKMRFSFKSNWTQSLAPNQQYTEQDAFYEAASMLVNNALWLTKHAAYVAAVVAEPTEKEAKEVHKCLKKAAGQFKFVQDNLANKFIKAPSNQPKNFFDMNDLILSTYINQCKAEAQESKLSHFFVFNKLS